MLRISWGITGFLTAKRLHIVAQGKQRRVLRAFVSPWVEETRDPRPRIQGFFLRRVVEAETCRGYLGLARNVSQSNHEDTKGTKEAKIP